MSFCRLLVEVLTVYVVVCYVSYQVSICSFYKYNVPSSIAVSLVRYVFGTKTIPVKVVWGIFMRKRVYMFSYIEYQTADIRDCIICVCKVLLFYQYLCKFEQVFFNLRSK